MTNPTILTYWPEKTLTFNTQTCILVWENGAGKSSLARFLKSNDPDNIYYIPAQRDLVIHQETLRGKTEKELENEMGLINYSIPNKSSITTYKPDYGDYFYSNLDYFTNNIKANNFIAYIEKIKRDDTNKRAYWAREGLPQSDTPAQRIFNIWNKIFKKQIKFNKEWQLYIDINWVYWKFENISDGERLALYMIILCLSAPENSVIIVDEPETHLNSAIVFELWDLIEQERNNCKFIYISHNIDFITSRVNSSRFWIKNFTHPNEWEIIELNLNELPEELILKIIGSKKEKILFIEWQSWDECNFYQSIYKDFKVIPVGSCEGVIQNTKILKSQWDYRKDFYWLIDRDLKWDDEINALQNDNIFVLPVAEFENLLFNKEIIEEYLKCLWREEEFGSIFQDIEQKINKLCSDNDFKSFFLKYSIHQEFNRNLANFSIPHENTYNFSLNLDDKIQEFHNLQSKSYDEKLRYLNLKDIKWVASNIEAGWYNKYLQQIIRFINMEHWKHLKDKFMEILPKIWNNQ